MVVAIITAENCGACVYFKNNLKKTLSDALVSMGETVHLYDLKDRNKVNEEMALKKAPPELTKGIRFVPTLAYSADSVNWVFYPDAPSDLGGILAWTKEKASAKNGGGAASQQASIGAGAGGVERAAAANYGLKFPNGEDKDNRKIRLYSQSALASR